MSPSRMIPRQICDVRSRGYSLMRQHCWRDLNAHSLSFLVSRLEGHLSFSKTRYWKTCSMKFVCPKVAVNTLRRAGVAPYERRCCGRQEPNILGRFQAASSSLARCGNLPISIRKQLSSSASLKGFLSTGTSAYRASISLSQAVKNANGTPLARSRSAAG